MSGGSYPIKDEENLKNAIHAVGRGGQTTTPSGSTSSTGPGRSSCPNLIPENWNSDGSLKDADKSSNAPADSCCQSGQRCEALPKRSNRVSPRSESRAVRRCRDEYRCGTTCTSRASPR